MTAEQRQPRIPVRYKTAHQDSARWNELEFRPGDIVGKAVVWQGGSDTVPLKLAGALDVTMPVDSRAGMKLTLNYDGPVQAPVAKDQQVGTLKITAPDFPGLVVPVYAVNSVGSAGFFARIFLGLRALISPNSAGR